MYINAAQILQIVSICSAIAAAAVCLYKGFKWLDQQNQQDNAIKDLGAKHDKDIKEIKEEQRILCYANLATLDGLKQLGANGNVSDAHTMLEKHLNKSAHE